ncbi:MAG: hypothetical protein ACJ8FA_04160, partial [Xanthobacteraceae bacterium]
MPAFSLSGLKDGVLSKLPDPGVPFGLDYLSRRMAKSRHSALRKTWWMPQTIATVGFVWSGVRNLRVASG